MDNEDLYARQKHTAVTGLMHLSKPRTDVDFRHWFPADGARKQPWGQPLAVFSTDFCLHWSHTEHVAWESSKGLVETHLALCHPQLGGALTCLLSYRPHPLPVTSVALPLPCCLSLNKTALGWHPSLVGHLHRELLLLGGNRSRVQSLSKLRDVPARQTRAVAYKTAFLSAAHAKWRQGTHCPLVCITYFHLFMQRSQEFDLTTVQG